MQTKITQFAPAILAVYCTFLSTLFTVLYAQEAEKEIDFFDNQNQIIGIASAMDRPIMLVIDGVGGSSAMDRTTFKDARVVDYLNNNFANYRISVNSTEGSVYYSKYGLGKYLLKDYPIYIFLEADAQTPIPVAIEAGQKSPETLLSIAGNALNKRNRAAQPIAVGMDLKNKARDLFESEFRYQNDVKDEGAMREFLYQMKELESLDDKVLHEYFRLRDYSVTKEACQQLILDFAENIQSPAFIELLQNKPYLSNTKGRGTIEKKIKSAIRASVVMASLKNDKAAFSNALDEIDNANLQDSDDYKAEMLVLYNDKINDWNGIAKTISDYCASGKARNADIVNMTALRYAIRTDEKAKLETVNNWLKTAELLKPNAYVNLEAQALVSYKLGVKKNRKELLERALVEAKKAGDNRHSVSLLNLSNLMEGKASVNSVSYTPEFSKNVSLYR